MISRLRVFFAFVTCHPLGWIGSLSITFGSIYAVAYVLFSILLRVDNQYLGILFLIVSPPLFFGGLMLIPLGIHLRVRAARRKDPQLADHSVRDVLYIVTGAKSVQPIATTFLALSGVNVVLTMLILMLGYNYMESNQFCGEVCHVVMEPEYVVYSRSPHARVECVECHIGSGASWFVKSKLSGTRQLWNVAMGTYHKPIPVPIEHLRPSRETCQHCHWTEKFLGEKLKVITHFEPDRDNTKLYTVLLIKVGGPDTVPGKASGVHWHVAEGNRVSFISDKDERKDIPWVEYQRKGEKPVEFFFTGSSLTKEEIAKASKRTMECVDCHNRPTHVYQMPEEAIEQILREDPRLQTVPFLKKTGLDILNMKFSEDAIEKGDIERTVLAKYAEAPLHTEGVDQELLAVAAREIQGAYRRNVWPRMNIEWGTYANHISHIHSPGCLRCHSNTHRTAEGKAINSDCRICHTILAIREKDPEILKVLR